MSTRCAWQADPTRDLRSARGYPDYIGSGKHQHHGQCVAHQPPAVTGRGTSEESNSLDQRVSVSPAEGDCTGGRQVCPGERLRITTPRDFRLSDHGRIASNLLIEPESAPGPVHEWVEPEQAHESRCN